MFTHSPLRRWQALWTGLGLGLFWLLLVWRGFPFPYTDDGYFMGISLSLAGGHGLFNPLMAGSGPFYIYPPVYPFLFAAWLKVTGVSVTSVVVAFGLAAWATTWWTIRACQIAEQESLGWMVVAALVVYFPCVGLRPDLPSLFCLSLSLRAGVSERFWIRAVAPFFALLAVSMLPAALALAVPWLLYLLLTDRKLWWPAGLGAALVLAMVTAMLHGKIVDFWIGFTANARGSTGGQINWFRAHALSFQGLVKFSYPVLLVLLLVVTAVRRRGFRTGDIFFPFMVLLGLYVSSASVSGQRILAIAAVAGGGWYLLERGARAPWNLALAVASAALITGAELRPLLQGLTTGKTRDSDRILAEVDAQHPSLLVVDAWSLRYVFHYHLRPGMIFIGEKTRPGSGAPFAQRKYPDECWVISAETVLDRNLHEPGLPVPHPLMICSHPVGQWVTNAGEVKVVPATGP